MKYLVFGILSGKKAIASRIFKISWPIARNLYNSGWPSPRPVASWQGVDEAVPQKMDDAKSLQGVPGSGYLPGIVWGC